MIIYIYSYTHSILKSHDTPLGADNWNVPWTRCLICLYNKFINMAANALVTQWVDLNGVAIYMIQVKVIVFTVSILIDYGKHDPKLTLCIT